MSESASVRLRRSINDTKLLLMPGGFSPLAVRMAESLGFESFFLAGSQTSGHIYGVPDIALIGRKEMAEAVRNIAAVSSMPVLVDSDTGYGNAVNVYHATEGYIRAGAAGLHLEDQLAPKLSGTAAGKRCIPVEEAVGKYKAAVAARDALDPDFVICARCDFIGAEGGDLRGRRRAVHSVQGRGQRGPHLAEQRPEQGRGARGGGTHPRRGHAHLRGRAAGPDAGGAPGVGRCSGHLPGFDQFRGAAGGVGAAQRLSRAGPCRDGRATASRRRRASGGRSASTTSCTRTRRWCARSRTTTCRRNRSGTTTPPLGITHRRLRGLAGPLTPERSSPRNAIMSATVVISVT